MGKVIPFSPSEPEREVISFEVLPEWETEPGLYVKYLYNKGLIKSESQLLAAMESLNRSLRK